MCRNANRPRDLFAPIRIRKKMLPQPLASHARQVYRHIASSSTLRFDASAAKHVAPPRQSLPVQSDGAPSCTGAAPLRPSLPRRQTLPMPVFSCCSMNRPADILPAVSCQNGDRRRTTVLFRLCALCDLCGEFSSGPRPSHVRRPHHRRECSRKLVRQKVEKKCRRPESR